MGFFISLQAAEVSDYTSHILRFAWRLLTSEVGRVDFKSKNIFFEFRIEFYGMNVMVSKLVFLAAPSGL